MDVIEVRRMRRRSNKSYYVALNHLTCISRKCQRVNLEIQEPVHYRKGRSIE
jgi:hypothetical protein